MFVTPTAGLAGLAAAGATAVAGDHSIAVAVITAASGFGVVIAAQIGAAIRDSLKTKRHPAVDHEVEHRDEMLDLVEFLRGELVELRDEVADLKRQKRGRQ